MGTFANAFGPHAPDATYVDHGYDEQLFDTGEVELNYVITGDASQARAAADPGPDRVVVGLREGARPAWRSTSRPSPSTSAARDGRAAPLVATRST